MKHTLTQNLAKPDACHVSKPCKVQSNRCKSLGQVAHITNVLHYYIMYKTLSQKRVITVVKIFARIWPNNMHIFNPYQKSIHSCKTIGENRGTSYAHKDGQTNVIPCSPFCFLLFVLFFRKGWGHQQINKKRKERDRSNSIIM